MIEATSRAQLNHKMKKGKSLYAAGEIPPIGHLPTHMHAFAVRQDRHGEPRLSLKEEIVPTPVPGSGEVVIMVMAAGVSMSTIWSCLGIPTTPSIAGTSSYQIPGSDCAGVVWAVGGDVTDWQVGEEVVVYPVVQRDGLDSSVDSIPAQVWGYETSHGALAQFACVRAEQLLQRPLHLTWAESACHLSGLATAYRMLFGHPPHVVGPGKAVLVWGAAQGIGAMAIQLIHVFGATAVAVVGDSEQEKVSKRLGASAIINLNYINYLECCEILTDIENYKISNAWKEKNAAFTAAAHDALGQACGFDIVLECPGRITFPLSCQLVRRGGMVVFSSGTTGYTFSFDARPAWRREIRLQGSHLPSWTDAAAANKLVHAGSINPCLAAVFDWQEAPAAHTHMLHSGFQPDNMAVLVQSRDKNDRTRFWKHE